MLDVVRTKAEIIADLARKGLSSREIVAATGYRRTWVSTIYWRTARGEKPWRRLQHSKGARMTSLSLSQEDWDRLAPHAEARDLSVPRLVARLARVCARQDLIDAILDDRA